MFFRREKPRQVTFEDRLNSLRQAGFAVEKQSDGTVRAERTGCAAILKDTGAELPEALRVGVLVGNEIAQLVNGGYQQFLITPSNRRFAAQAFQLKALHKFNEDLKEALGLESYYNTSLGTTSTKHLYDRVQGRDAGTANHEWQKDPLAPNSAG